MKVDYDVLKTVTIGSDSKYRSIISWGSLEWDIEIGDDDDGEEFTEDYEGGYYA